MHGHTQLAPHYFFRQQRLLRALLIDDQAWFVLDDFARLIEHSQPEQMLARLDDDQARRESLRSERGEDQAQWLISESGAYAALIYQQRGDGGLPDLFPIIMIARLRDAALQRRLGGVLCAVGADAVEQRGADVLLLQKFQQALLILSFGNARVARFVSASS